MIRITVLSIWLFILLNTPYELYALLPQEAIHPQGIGRWFLETDVVDLYSASALGLLRWTGIAACAVAIAWPRRWLMLVVLLDVLLLDAISKSISDFPNHAQSAALMTLLVMTLIGVNREWQARAGLASGSAVVWLTGLMLVIPYTYIGLNRLREGGIELFAGDALPRYIAQTSLMYSAYPFAMPADWLRQPVLVFALKAGFLVTTLLEISSAAVFVSMRFRLVWLLGMSLFHGVTLLTMRILFWENLMLMWIIFGWAFLPHMVRARGRFSAGSEAFTVSRS